MQWVFRTFDNIVSFIVKICTLSVYKGFEIAHWKYILNSEINVKVKLLDFVKCQDR